MTDNDVALIIEQNRQTHAAIASLKGDLGDLTSKFEAHVVEDRRQLAVLERHDRYFVIGGRVAKFIGIPLIVAIAAKFGIEIRF